MALALYSRYMFYPGGGQAANREIRVTLVGSNALPPLFADKAGTTPVPNPAVTDAEGLLSFYAAPGAFMVEFAGETFLINVDPAETDEVQPNLFVHEQTVPATTWTINHMMGVEPRVDVLINKTSTSEAVVSHPDKETAVVTFGEPTTGTANLRR